MASQKRKQNVCIILRLNLRKLGTQVILLECLESNLARRICNDCSIPVIGIGSGNSLDGQVAVIYDFSV